MATGKNYDILDLGLIYDAFQELSDFSLYKFS
jgi:hypothetical protein